jgi:hypothetical protein
MKVNWAIYQGEVNECLLLRSNHGVTSVFLSIGVVRTMGVKVANTLSQWESRSCPACGSTKLPRNPEVSSRVRAENLEPSEVEDYFIGIRPGQVFFSYWRCSNCSLLYCPKYFNSAQLQSAYARMPDNSMGNSETIARKNQNRYADWILRERQVSESFLELGPDLGLLSERLIESWKPREVVFVEPNEEMHHRLQSLSGPDKILLQTSIDSPLDATIPDSIVGVHVFDHLLDPVSKLRDLRNSSTQDAQVFFVVHNENSIMRRLLGRRFPPFCLQHPQLFSPATAKTLFEFGGWKLTSKSRTLNSFNLDNQLQMLIRVLGFGKLPFHLLKSLVVTLPLGNFIASAKKI